MTQTTAPEVTRLRIYPLKGGRGTNLTSMEFDEIGPKWDRRWMVVDDSNTFVTQRTWGDLARIIPTLAENHLGLEFDSDTNTLGGIQVPLNEGDGDTGTVTVWRSEVTATFPSAEADEWLSTVGGQRLRLAYMAPSSVRSTNPEFAPGGRVSFADGYPLLLISEAAVSKLQEKTGLEIDLERFRPNVVVNGTTAQAEDFWREVRIGESLFKGVKLCARCKVITLDQSTGEQAQGGEPLRTLATYRQIEKKVYFGVNMMVPAGGSISVGDSVEVLKREAVPGND